MNNIRTVQKSLIENERALVRVDFDVPLDGEGNIVDDTRITANIPTLKHLLRDDNRLILIAKLGRPQGIDPKLSLKTIADVLPSYLPGYTCRLVDNFLNEPTETFAAQGRKEIILLENIRFYSDEERLNPSFLNALCLLGTVFINDAFAMSHRDEVTVTGIPKHLPSFAGLQLEKEIDAIDKIIHSPKKPVVAIVGGSKIETKVEPIKKLIEICDHILVGGGIANTFLKAHGYDIGDSLYEESEVQHAKDLIEIASKAPVSIVLPVDARVGSLKMNSRTAHVVSLPTLPENGHILDIGPSTEDIYEEIIEQAHTIIWNGPMGVFERDEFRLGTDAIYRAIIHNQESYSLVGGGDTLAALSRKRRLHDINHISTGGGAMLHYIEHGDLPGLEALRKAPQNTSKRDY